MARASAPPGLTHLRVTFSDDFYLGPGRADLLEGIAETGSIAAAGKRMGMSYKRAWSLVQALNDGWGRALGWLAALLLLPAVGAGRLLLAGAAPWWLLAYPLFSLVAFFAYWRDKRSAEQGAWRTPEQTLHLLELLGGWPGAFLAQRLLRHKTRKPSYQLVFWAIVLLHQVIWLDRLLGGVLLCCGHFAMAIEGHPARIVDGVIVRDEAALQVFYFALALIIVGVGFLKANVSTLVGAGLYEFGDVQGKREVARLQHPLDVCADPRGLTHEPAEGNGRLDEFG